MFPDDEAVGHDGVHDGGQDGLGLPRMAVMVLGSTLNRTLGPELCDHNAPAAELDACRGPAGHARHGNYSYLVYISRYLADSGLQLHFRCVRPPRRWDAARKGVSRPA